MNHDSLYVCMRADGSEYGVDTASGCAKGERAYYSMTHDTYRVCVRADGSEYDVDPVGGHCASGEDQIGRCALPGATTFFVSSIDQCKNRGGRLLGKPAN